MNKKEIKDILDKEINWKSLMESMKSSIKFKSMDNFEKGYRMALLQISELLGISKIKR